MRLRTSLLLCALLSGTAGVSALHAAPLPVPVHPDTLPTLEQSWRLPASLAPTVTNCFAPRIALSGMLLYVYDHHGRRLAAVDATSGKVVWHTPVPSSSDRAFAVTPLVARERVFVASDGYVFAFDALTGKQAWIKRTKGVALNGLARSKHRLLLPFLQTSGAQALPGVNVWALDSRNGAVEWNKRFPGNMGYVLGDAEAGYLVTDGGAVLALTSDRGEPKWQLRVKGEVQQQPLLHKGRIYVTSVRKKAGWSGTGLTVIDAGKGRVVWEAKLSATLVSPYLHDGQLMVVEASGQLTEFDAAGKRVLEMQLGFGDEPLALHATAVGNRAFVFSYHAGGNGYVRLVDLEKKRVLATANAINMDVRALLPAAKVLFLDAADGDIHAVRMDRSQRPKRATVAPDEFAKEMLDRALDTRLPVRGLAQKLAGLGPKALPAIEPGLASPNPVVVDVAAHAVGLIGEKKSVPALIKAVTRLQVAAQPPEAKVDPLIAVVEALAALRDGRAVAVLTRLMKDVGQGHRRRRAAYVALGAIGSPVALAPLWAFRAAKQLNTYKWEPQTFTASYDYQVEADTETTAASWPESIRRETSLTVQGKNEQVYTAALAPYLGGYNDIWIGRSDLSGIITAPAYFTGLTRPETAPNRRLRVRQLAVTEQGEATLVLEASEGTRVVQSKPLKLTLDALLADSDGDKLPDVIERRLHTCVHNADCDGDGIKDGEDLNPLASGKLEPTAEQRLFRESFFAFYSFLRRRGLVVVDPGDGPSFELYGRQDPILSLRRTTIEKLRKEIGLHAVDYVSFGGPYPEGGGSGDALPQVVWSKKKTEATIGMDVFRSGENAVAFNVTLRKSGKSWVVTRFFRVWTTN